VLDTRYGKASLVRIALLLVALPIVRSPRRQVAPAVTALECALGIGLLATLTAAGHAGTGRWIPLAVVTDIVHLSAAAVWLGGVAVLAIALSAGIRSPGVVRATARFSKIAAPAIAVIAATGTVQAIRQIEDVDSVLDSSYGRLVLTKTVLLVFIVAAASVSRYIVRRWTGFMPLPAGPGAAVAEADDQDVRDLRDALIVEVAIAALVLACTAVLVNTEPTADRGGTSSSAAAANEPFATTLEEDGLGFAISLDPAGVGANQLRVDVTSDGQPFEPIELTAALEEGTRGIAPIDVTLTPGAAGSYTGSADLPFAGQWELTIRALRTEIEEVAVTTTIDVR
jgi:copper transport protein